MKSSRFHVSWEIPGGRQSREVSTIGQARRVLAKKSGEIREINPDGSYSPVIERFVAGWVVGRPAERGAA